MSLAHRCTGNTCHFTARQQHGKQNQCINGVGWAGEAVRRSLLSISPHFLKLFIIRVHLQREKPKTTNRKSRTSRQLKVTNFLSPKSLRN